MSTISLGLASNLCAHWLLLNAWPRPVEENEVEILSEDTALGQVLGDMSMDEFVSIEDDVVVCEPITIESEDVLEQEYDEEDVEIVRNLPSIPKMLLSLRDMRDWSYKNDNEEIRVAASHLESLFQKQATKAVNTKQTSVLSYFQKKQIKHLID